MGKKLINTCFTYSFELKKEAVELYLSGHSRKQIVSQLGIKNPRTVNEWVQKVQIEGWEGLQERRGLMKGSSKGRPKKVNLSLEEENKLLKAEILYLKKSIEQKRGC
jgi:transposase-like protein